MSEGREFLDEFPEEDLLAELKRREEARATGRCDYCRRSNETKSCKYRKRHYDKRIASSTLPIYWGECPEGHHARGRLQAPNQLEGQPLVERFTTHCPFQLLSCEEDMTFDLFLPDDDEEDED